MKRCSTDKKKKENESDIFYIRLFNKKKESSGDLFVIAGFCTSHCRAAEFIKQTFEKYKRRYIIHKKIRMREAIDRKMFSFLLYCTGFVAILSAASVSTESRVDFTPYSALLALLTGNTDFVSNAQQSPYLRRYSQHGKYFFLLIFGLI